MDGPKRILHVVVNMNRGGAETLLMNLYRNIDRTKIQFDFLTCKEGAFDEEIREMGGIVHRIPYVTDVGHFGFIRALNRFFPAHPEYRIVHSHLDKISGFVLKAAKKANLPIRIAHSHNTESEGRAAARAYKWYAGRQIGKTATHFMACSKEAAAWLFPGRERQTIPLKNGIECERFAFSSEIREQVRQELGLDGDAFVVGHIGRFFQQKNHSFLIDLFERLHREMPNAVLVMAGDGPLRSEMEEKVQGLGLGSRVQFLGIRSDVDRLLQAFDVFAFPSFHEGLPVTLIEAQGAGLPCVISDVISQETDMGIGLIRYAPLADKGAWVEKIRQAASERSKRDEPVQEALSRSGCNIKHTARWAQDFYAITR